MLEINKVYKEDCIGEKGMCLIDDKSVDMILCDLPYGQTRLIWDSVLPLNVLWEHYNRIIKYNGVVVLMAQQPFTSILTMSNLKMFKYELIWEKTRSPSFAHAKFKPMAIHENILIFSKSASTYTKDETKRMKYNPQMEEGAEYTISKKAHGKVAGNAVIENADQFQGKTNSGRYPKSIRKIANPAKGTIHPAQKPVALFEWLIKSYTNEGDLVLDNCAGSFTTVVACINTKRNYIGFENDEKYFDLGQDRVNNLLKSKN